MLIAELVFVNTCRGLLGKSLHDRRLTQFLLERLMRCGWVQFEDWEISSLGMALLWTLPSSPSRQQLIEAIDGHAEFSRLVHETNTLLSDCWPNMARLIAYRPRETDLQASRLADACGSEIEPYLITIFERRLLVDSGADIGDWLRKATPAGPHANGPHDTRNLASLVRAVVRGVMAEHRGVVYPNLRLEFLRRCIQRMHHWGVNQAPENFLNQIGQNDPLERRLIEAVHKLPEHRRFVLLATAFGAFPVEDLATALSDDDAPHNRGNMGSDEVISELQFAWEGVFREIL